MIRYAIAAACFVLCFVCGRYVWDHSQQDLRVMYATLSFVGLFITGIFAAIDTRYSRRRK